ncbi:hypothetical protein [Luteibaculum oceani]|uniref:Uncharacterized protein n=1 Tax=Luteibaculum oceani TaxID=1294296 RepID=A0A5C6UTG1_9FLAO|nr:hypothetical protein [Luteibaculum oceani]TXC76259.1 hypothetical protein FRX97_10965 [Luteibaculum oceani]
MEKIAIQTCDCAGNLDEEITGDKKTMQFGLCIIEAAQPYAKELKKDYNIDMDLIHVQGEDLGRLVGIEMVKHCPDFLMSLAEGELEEAGDQNSGSEDFVGVLQDVKKKDFLEFHFTDNAGRLYKFLWLTYINTDLNLYGDMENHIGKEYRVSFIEKEFYDPKIGEYRPFKILESIRKF